MNKSLIARTIAAFAVVAALLLGFTPAAQAATASVTSSVPAVMKIDNGPTLQTSACSIDASSTGGAGASNSSLLPVNRWADATANMHSRLDNTFWSDSATLMQRHSLVGFGMTTGNAMWSLGTGMTALAINFCMLDSFGGQADKIVADIGKAMKGSPLLAFLVLAGVIGLLFQGRRAGNLPWKALAGKGLILGMFIIMVTGATASVGGGAGTNPNAPYKPGNGSPGWVVTTINNTVSELSTGPAKALVLTTDDIDGAKPGSFNECKNYTDSLKRAYESSYGSGSGKLASGIPMILSSLWEDTGLQTWRMAQFGPTGVGDGKSGIDSSVWCHQLEMNSTVPVAKANESAAWSDSVRANLVRSGANIDNVHPKSGAFTTTDNVTRDRSLIAWGACDPKQGSGLSNGDNWNIDKEFKDSGVTKDDCAAWWTKSLKDAGNLDAFDWPGSAKGVNEKAGDNTDLSEFVLTLHGNNNAHGLTSVLAYNLSALCMLVVFGGLAIGVIVAKVAMVMMIIGGLFVVMMSLLPRADMSKIGGYAKTLMGISIFVFGLQLLFAFISIITKMLQSLGTQFLGGPGSIIATFWSGFSPLIAVIMLHLLFTKVLKVPSPFKISAGMAWGGAATAAGGAALGGAAGLLNRQQSRAGNLAKRGGGALLNKASGGRINVGPGAKSRRGQAAPVAEKAGIGKGTGAPGSPNDSVAPGQTRKGQSLPSETASAVGLDPSVANSQAVSGKMSSKERQEVRAAARKERDEARAAENLHKSPLKQEWQTAKVAAHNAAMGASVKTVEGLGAGWSRIKKTGAEIKTHPVQGSLAAVRGAGSVAKKGAIHALNTNVGQAFRDKPLRTSAKVAAGGLLLASTAPALAIPLVAAGAVGAFKGGQAVKRATLDRSKLNDERVQRYRTALADQNRREQEAAAAAEAEQEKLEAQEQQKQNDRSNQPLEPSAVVAGSNVATTEAMPSVSSATAAMPTARTGSSEQQLGGSRPQVSAPAPQKPEGQKVVPQKSPPQAVKAPANRQERTAPPSGRRAAHTKDGRSGAIAPQQKPVISKPKGTKKP